MTDVARRILYGEKIELESYRETPAIFLLKLPLIVLVSLIFPGLLILLFDSSFENHILRFLCAILAIGNSIILARSAGKEIGYRNVMLDTNARALVVTQHFSFRPDLRNEHIPFNDLLLIRLWQRSSEDDSAAFIIRLQVSKNAPNRPDLSGFLLHVEYADHDARNAERATSQLVSQLVEATGIEFFDLQGSNDPRYAPWINPSL